MFFGVARWCNLFGDVISCPVSSIKGDEFFQTIRRWKRTPVKQTNSIKKQKQSLIQCKFLHIPAATEPCNFSVISIRKQKKWNKKQEIFAIFPGNIFFRTANPFSDHDEKRNLECQAWKSNVLHRSIKCSNHCQDGENTSPPLSTKV